MQKRSFEAIGTTWTIETPEELAGSVKHLIDERIEQFDQTYSRFREDSLVYKLRQPGQYVFPDDAAKMIEQYREFYDVTGGAVTPLVGEILEKSGYDAAYSLAPADHIEQAPRWDEAMEWTGSRVKIRQPIVLDVGALGKGYLVDIIAEILTSHNIHECVIDASGDICHRGATPDRVGLENPFNTESVIGIAPLHHASLCASASNRRAWGDRHHIVDPRTGEPVRDVVATWAIAESTLLADGLATALFFVPPTELSRWDFQAVRLMSDGRVEYTENFMGELFI